MKFKKIISGAVALASISSASFNVSAVSDDELIGIATGYTSYTVEDGYINFESFTDEHKNVFSGFHREHAEKEQVVLSFVTDSSNFSFDYAVEVDKTGYIDVFVDGVYENGYNVAEIGGDGKFSYSLTGRECRVDVYLPRNGIKIKNFEFAPGSKLSKVTDDTKVVFYGDSITFGTGLEKISETYVSVLSRVLGYEFVNYGIGGYYFNPNQFVEQKTFEADVVFVAYGANDSGSSDMSAVKKNIEGFMDNLRRMYPEQKVYVITPLWTNDGGKTDNIGKVREMITEVCKGRDNVQIIDGLSLVPADTAYFSDGLHPNKIGNLVMAKNIAMNIDSSLYTDVTDMGVYDDVSGNFSFNEYPANILNGNSYAYYKDCVIGLDGQQAVYENGRFYVPSKLMDILAGKQQPTVYNGNIPEMTVDIEPVYDSEMKCRINFTNMLHEKEISGTFAFTAPESFASLEPIKIEKIPAGEKYCYEFDCSDIDLSKPGYFVESEIKTDDGKIYKNSSLFRGYVQNNYAEKQIIADGVISDEWKDAVKITVDSDSSVKAFSDRAGAEDLSFDFATMWDEDYLYFYADVKDNVFSQTNAPSSVWRGDCVQIGLYDNSEGRLLTGYAGSQFEEIALAVVEGKPVAYRFLNQTPNTKAGLIEQDDEFEIGCAKSDDGVIYEMKISWKKLFGRDYAPQNGDSIGFSVLANDDDGNGRRGWIEYGSGIGYSKDVNEFVKMQLCAEEITVLYDGEKVNCDVKPFISDDRVLVPVRAIFEKLGAEVAWNSETRTVTAVRGDETVQLQIDSNIINVNGTDVEIDVPAMITDDRTFVPVRAVSESFGCDVDWDGETKTVIIKGETK